MTPHDHRMLVPGCFRCELGQDEAQDAQLDVQGIFDRVLPIIEKTYGKSATAIALADHLSLQLSDYAGDQGDREHMVMTTCWNWFSGGSTAEHVAADIEAALNA